MKELFIFLGGVVVGGAAMLLWLRKDFTKKLEEKYDELEKDSKIEAKEDKFREYEEEKNRNNVEEDPVKLGFEGTTDRLGYTNYAGNVGENRVFQDKNEINNAENEENDASLLDLKSGACARKSGALDESNYENDDFDDEIPPPEGGLADAPYGISVEDFLHSNPHFSKSTLIYYAEDDVFTDECATFCANAPLLVGEKWRMEIGKYQENVAYIRNEKVGADFEIIVESCGYGNGDDDDYRED